MYVIGDGVYSVVDLQYNKVILSSKIEFINRPALIYNDYVVFIGTEQDNSKSLYNALVYDVNSDHSLTYRNKIDLSQINLRYTDWTSNNIIERSEQSRFPYSMDGERCIGYNPVDLSKVWDIELSDLGDNPTIIYQNNAKHKLIFASDIELTCVKY